ncbi:MAG: DUF3224 domain-containing protein [Caldilineaceae bacterium]
MKNPLALKVHLLIFLMLLLSIMLSACQAGPNVIQAEYVLAGPPSTEESTAIGEDCLLHLVFPWQIEGNLQGTAITDYRILLHGPCDSGIGDVDEAWVYSGTFEGQLDGRTGTFNYYAFADVKDRILTGQLAIVPGSGGGELAGIAGVLSFNVSVDTETTPLTGYYYFTSGVSQTNSN